ncbi:MAG: patatin-like phospholipase family protein [Lautropia sp.]
MTDPSVLNPRTAMPERRHVPRARATAAATTAAASPAAVAGLGPDGRPIGLVLTGGGARAAYQAGALLGVRRVLIEAGWPAEANPFRVVTGTSAGAINAASIAAGSHDFFGAVARLAMVWGNFEPAQVYRVDAGGALGNAARWLGALGLGWLVDSQPRALFDTAPLRDLLLRMIDFEQLQRNFAQGRIDALAVATSSYSSGHHVTFYQCGGRRDPWVRSQRIAQPATLGVDHLMASSAIPFLFPSIALPMASGVEYFGDGAMRQTAPISPAVHLDAGRILVIGAAPLPAERARDDARALVGPPAPASYPSLAQVGGHALASIFFDSLANDLERINRINHTLSLMPPEIRERSPLRALDTLVICPSRPLDRLAAAHLDRLPRSVRALLRVVGVTKDSGSGIASYLLFDRSYTRRLIALGRRDAMAKRAEIARFFGLGR